MVLPERRTVITTGSGVAWRLPARHSRAVHDIRLIRENPTAFDAALARRGLAPAAPELLALDEQRRAKAPEAQVAQARRNGC